MKSAQIPAVVAVVAPPVEPSGTSSTLQLLDSSTRLGEFKLTRYHVADQTASAAGAEVGIYDDRGCKELARVSRAFARQLDLQGTGRLADGTVLNVWKKDCGCRRTPCYRALGADARWGMSAVETPLEPFRTIAVDPDVIALGSHLYLPELDGLTMPGQAPWGGFVHDGCVVAADVGNGVEGKQVDLFVGRRQYQQALDGRRRIEQVTVFAADERCGARGGQGGQMARDTGI